MPLYEYECRRCELSFEELVFNSSEKVKCPKCKKTNVERKLSAFAAHGLSKPISASGGSSCGGCSKGGGGCSGCSH